MQLQNCICTHQLVKAVMVISPYLFLSTYSSNKYFSNPYHVGYSRLGQKLTDMDPAQLMEEADTTSYSDLSSLTAKEWDVELGKGVRAEAGSALGTQGQLLLS